MRQELVALLDRFLVTHSPSGIEQEMDAQVAPLLEESGQEVQHDRHGNLWVRFPGRQPGPLTITASEESGCSGAAYLSRKLEPDDLIAVEIAPVAEEYPTVMGEDPVVLFKDGSHQYSADLSRALVEAGQRRGLSCQSAVVRSFGSDASVAQHLGLSGRAACHCFPTENTHGYEITTLGSLEACVLLLAEHLAPSAEPPSGRRPRKKGR